MVLEGGTESGWGCALFGSILIASMKLSRYFLHRPAGTAVDALLDLALDELFEVFSDEVVRRHECGPNQPL